MYRLRIELALLLGKIRLLFLIFGIFVTIMCSPFGTKVNYAPAPDDYRETVADSVTRNAYFES